jgi:hypothetical protein
VVVAEKNAERNEEIRKLMLTVFADVKLSLLAEDDVRGTALGATDFTCHFIFLIYVLKLLGDCSDFIAHLCYLLNCGNVPGAEVVEQVRSVPKYFDHLSGIQQLPQLSALTSWV